MTPETHRRSLQNAMVFLGSIASGTEQAIGESANSISYLAGVRLGKRLSADAPRTDDVIEALQATRDVLEKSGCLWMFEPFKTHNQMDMIQETENGKEIMLVFRDCMIRQALFRFGHVQKGSLCNMLYGFFSGVLQNIMGQESSLEIIHAGENACLKKLVIRRAS